MLADDWGVQADTWSVTSWNELARDGVAAEEWNLLHPGEPSVAPPTSADKLAGAAGPVVAVSDYMRAVPLQIARWVPADYRVLGADGFGFADTRPAARRFFHIDAQSASSSRRSRRWPTPASSRWRRSSRPPRSTASTTRLPSKRRQAGGRRRLSARSHLTRRGARAEDVFAQAGSRGRLLRRRASTCTGATGASPASAWGGR